MNCLYFSEVCPIPLPMVFALIIFLRHHYQRFQCHHTAVYAHGHGGHAGRRRYPAGTAHEFCLCSHAGIPTMYACSLSAECFKVDIGALVRRNIL